MGKPGGRAQTSMAGWSPGIPVLTAMILFVIYQNHPLWAGFWLGLAVGILNFHALAAAAGKAVWLQKEQARRYMTRSYMIRYGMRFVILAIAFVIYDIHPITLLAGLTLPTVVAVLMSVVRTR